MKLRMTDGKSGFTFRFDEKEQEIIKASARPVSKALDITRKRLGAETFSGLYPVDGQCLTF